MLQAERWGPLRERYETVRPRRLLSLDGGGIRGLISLGILEKLEDQLRQTVADPSTFRLCDWFDYIGGTSTGAIIATGLARGMSVRELIAFYKNCGSQMFHKSDLLERWKTFYQADPLREQLRAVFGEHTTLEPEHLRCLLLVVVRNATTDSPWPISSNPDAKYNSALLSDCNLRIPLWKLVRASTAAPVYFPPEVICWDASSPAHSASFVDGGLTPYNNPAFLLYRMATQPAYRLAWATGEENLLLVSVGTGAAPVLESGSEQVVGKSILSEAAALPGHLMYAVSVDQDILCRTFGRCTHGAPIDSELSDMIDPEDTAETPRKNSRAFRYVRYNADISTQGLTRLGLGHVPAERVQHMDAVDQMTNLLEVGRVTGSTLSLEALGPSVSLTRPQVAEACGAAIGHRRLCLA